MLPTIPAFPSRNLGPYRPHHPFRVQFAMVLMVPQVYPIGLPPTFTMRNRGGAMRAHPFWRPESDNNQQDHGLRITPPSETSTPIGSIGDPRIQNEHASVLTTNQLTDQQKEALEKRYAVLEYIQEEERQKLASELGLSAEQIKNWFDNNRKSGTEQRRMHLNRKHFTKEQKEVLKKRFSISKSISKNDCEELASELNVTSDRIKKWFSNRRTKQRAQSK
ncbi:unnamed protein product [Caenorhabditis sp. 36 PRJEB53466]|nr:unnamed protein product [Caenorhabditis sp. 36 PRJEB53466]